MDLYSLAFNNIRRRKLRSILTTLGIIIGVATIVMLLGVTTGVTSAIKDETNKYMYDVVVTPASSTGSYLMDGQTASDIRNRSELYDFREVTVFSEDIKGDRLFFEGTNNWKDVKLKTGTYGVVIYQSVADKYGYSIGSKIKVKNRELTVTGISKDTQSFYVFIDQSYAKQLAGNKVSAIYASTDGDPKTVSEEIERQINGISVETKSEKVNEVQEMTGQALLFTAIIASVALLVGIISVINTMLISVMERTKELGVLKAIGFTNWEIKGSILFESGLLGFSGGIVGVIFGIIGIIGIANVLKLTEYMYGMMPLWLILGVIVGSTLLSVLAGLYPAMRASKLNVVEALRNE
ncbi:MAG TPA: ABC transporter permease [Methanobacterium sp.]|jgi:putative ABC transport system permease protein|nr:ABC transporter permease [Methanobacterium sp.]HOI39736.1 ABC transporter permease [Methanobacterium sp.]